MLYKSFFLPTLVILLFCLNCAGKKKLKEENRPSYFLQAKILQTIQAEQQLRQDDDVYYWSGAGKTDMNDSTHLGTTVNIDYLGERLSSVRENRGSHCVGVSWQVCMLVLQDWAQQKENNRQIFGMGVTEMRDFADKWFVKLKGMPLAEPQEMGAVYALQSYNLGKRIPFPKARSGDFVQFWRKDNSGHSCIFLQWVYDKNSTIIGFKYWGSQPTTNGIGTMTEYFSQVESFPDPKRLLQKDRFYIGRLAPGLN